MKKAIILLLLGVVTLPSFAQKEKLENLQNFDKRKFRWAYYLGFHQRKYQLDVAPASQGIIEVSGGGGFQLGIVTDYKLGKHWRLISEPGIISSTAQLKFGTETRDLNNTFFHVPVLFKWKADRLNNIKPFAIGGFGIDYNFSANKNIEPINGNEFELSKINYTAEIGIGMDIYFEYFKFSPSIRGILGLNNEITPLGANAQNINTLKGRGLFITFTFQ